ncbi:guanine deaminase [bacterium]|nr:guanine deaminase [bacterium]
MRPPPLQFFTGNILNPRGDRECQLFSMGVMVVERRRGGSVIRELLAPEEAREKYASSMTGANTIDFGESLILPGFFDMHFHWVQDDVRTMPKDSLLQWLEKYTFPAEMKFVSSRYSREKARIFFRRLTKAGTIGGAVFSSVHENALHAAMKEARGDFIIGNVQMNMNSPDDLTRTERHSISGVRRLFRRYGRRYAFTPRFAITTSPQVMLAGGMLADRLGAFKQSHLSETLAEVDYTLSLYRKIPGFERVRTYTGIYRKAAMLGPRSLMAHGIHLSPAEMEILRRTRTSLVHCPTSNAPLSERGLGSGLFDFARVNRQKIRWALGSDIGGGPFLSMLDVMRSFVEQNGRAGRRGATRVSALYRATLAGAEILEVDDRTGNLDPGKEASFIVIPLPGSGQERKPEQLLTRLLDLHASRRERYDECVSEVFLNGQRVFPFRNPGRQ